MNKESELESKDEPPVCILNLLRGWYRQGLDGNKVLYLCGPGPGLVGVHYVNPSDVTGPNRNNDGHNQPTSGVDNRI